MSIIRNAYVETHTYNRRESNGKVRLLMWYGIVRVADDREDRNN